MKIWRSARVRTALSIVLVALVLLGGLAYASNTYLNPPLTSFYAPPHPLPPGKPGELIKAEKIQTNYANVQAWRVMYHSRDLRGNDVAVTGLFAAPTSAPPENGFPLLGIAHGTEGLARECAPSLDPWALPPFAQEFFSFPDTVVVPFVQAGYAVTATDYQGLGAAGNSAFLIGSIEAQNVLDSMRAIRSFDAIKLNEDNFVWGHSQGGHSAAFTAQLANEIAPELKLNGIVLAAPAAQLQTLVETVLAPDQPSFLTGVAAMVAASWSQTYDLPLDVVLTPQGKTQVLPLLQECSANAVLGFALAKPSSLYFADPTKTSPWSDTMRLNIAQGVKYAAPVFVAQGAADSVIAPQVTETFVQQLCAAGNAVEFRLYPNASHAQVVSASNADVVAWLNARANNEPAPSNCTAQVTMSPTPTPPPALQSVIFSDGAFTPDASTIAALEKQLPNFLAQQQNQFSAQKSPIAERLTQYKFQYWGEMQNEKRVVVVNAFCTNFDYWKMQRVFVLDGGDCFFNLKYDLGAGTFFDLQVNREA